MVLTLLQCLAAFLVAYSGVVLWAVFLRGPFRFAYNRFWARFLTKNGMDGITIGARCYTRTPELLAEFPGGFEPLNEPIDSPNRRWWRHERQHNRQWRVRPFMGPVYVYWEFSAHYAHNPLELEAIRAEDPPGTP